ncbi:MAG: metallophosphoesterase [Chloroflexota bacterium]
MRLAILADIHGNLPALEAILDHVEKQYIDQIIIAGDIVNVSPDSDKCWQLVQSLNCPIVRGNHERYASDYGTPNADPLWETEQFSPVRWTAAQFTSAERQQISSLPTFLRSAEWPDLLITHASLRSDKDSLKAFTPPESIQAMFGDSTEQTIVRGHNHLEYTYQWGEKQIITVGAAGLPLDGLTTARYSIVERVNQQWHNRPQAIPYDVDRAIRRFSESGYLEATYPMGRLCLREVATASHAFIPFLRLYRRWQADDPNGLGALTLTDAIERFSMMF